ncbi:hypothetical protein WA158_007257 [Blastocystis sp. Blastoise]
MINMKRSANEITTMDWQSDDEIYDYDPETRWKTSDSFYQDISYVRDSFNLVKEIGDGSYGVVFKAIRKEDNKAVALKKYKLPLNANEDDPVFKDDYNSIKSEITLMKELNHPNILSMNNIYHGRGKNSIYIEMPLYSTNLYTIIQEENFSFKAEEIRYIMYQLFSGLSYLHQHHYIHRDIKSANLLYSNGNIAISDFNLTIPIPSSSSSSSSTDSEPMSPVGTLAYRAMEIYLLPSSSTYTTAIDIWSSGIIFLELIMNKSLFSESGEITTLSAIIGMLGSPDESTCPLLKDPNCLSGFRLKHVPSKLNDQLKPYIETGILSEDGFNLLKQCLEFDTKKRITADEALRHPFFNSSPLLSKEKMPSLLSLLKQKEEREYIAKKKYLEELQKLFAE